MPDTEVELKRLPRDRFEDVVATFCAAFHDYPVMRFILKDAGRDYDRQLTELIGYFTDSRFSRGWPVFGVLQGERILAVANINPPEPAAAPAGLTARYERMREILGEAAIARYQAFAVSGEPFEPREPHYHLGMIGVDPASQGRGLARMLLDAVHEMSAIHSASSGVSLSTETPRNLPFYEHFGYRILGESRIEELVSWTLFRSDP